MYILLYGFQTKNRFSIQLSEHNVTVRLNINSTVVAKIVSTVMKKRIHNY